MDYVEKITLYKRDMLFFDRFNKSNFFKFKERLKFFIKKRKFPYLFLFLPIRFVPSMFKKKTVDIKYETDFFILKENLKNFFKDGKFNFLGLEMEMPHESRVADFSVMIFSVLSLIQGICYTDTYSIYEITANKKDLNILDCGANLGVFSMLASQIAPNSKIYSFEPSIEPFQVLKSWVEKNSIRNIFPLNYALGEKNKNAFILKSNIGVGILNVMEDSPLKNLSGVVYSKKQYVEVLTIDDFVFNREKLSSVDIIKIDTEGYERNVLSGAIKTIEKFKPLILCSAYHLEDDMLKIPEMILKINSEYKLKITEKGEKVFMFY